MSHQGSQLSYKKARFPFLAKTGFEILHLDRYCHQNPENKVPQDGTPFWTTLGYPFGLLFGPLWAPFGALWDPLGLHLGTFWASWGSFGALMSLFGALWDTFGALLGSFGHIFDVF